MKPLSKRTTLESIRGIRRISPETDSESSEYTPSPRKVVKQKSMSPETESDGVEVEYTPSPRKVVKQKSMSPETESESSEEYDPLGNVVKRKARSPSPRKVVKRRARSPSPRKVVKRKARSLSPRKVYVTITDPTKGKKIIRSLNKFPKIKFIKIMGESIIRVYVKAKNDNRAVSRVLKYLRPWIKYVGHVGLTPEPESSTDEDSYEHLTMIEVPDATGKKEYNFELGDPVEDFGTYGDLVLEASIIISERTGLPRLFYLLHDIRHYSGAYQGDLVSGVNVKIPNTSMEYDSISLSVDNIMDNDISEYIITLAKYTKDINLSMQLRLASNIIESVIEFHMYVTSPILLMVANLVKEVIPPKMKRRY